MLEHQSVLTVSREFMVRLAVLCLPKLSTAMHRRLHTCMAGLVLVLLLAGNVATLAYAYHRHHQGHLLLGGAVLCSVLALLPLALLLPHRRVFLRRAWLALHVTYSDDLARNAVRVLHDLQVRPLVQALGLVPPDTLDYWWWALQGLVLATLANRLSGPADPDDDDPDGDDPDGDLEAGRDPDSEGGEGALEEGDLREEEVWKGLRVGRLAFLAEGEGGEEFVEVTMMEVMVAVQQDHFRQGLDY